MPVEIHQVLAAYAALTPLPRNPAQDGHEMLHHNAKSSFNSALVKDYQMPAIEKGLAD